MYAKDLVSEVVLPLKTSDPGSYALHLMDDLHVKHLPIVNHHQLLGVISEEDLLQYDPDEPIGSFDLSLQKYAVKANDHIYEILRLMGDHQLTIIPVIDDDKNFLGTVTQSDVLEFFSRSASFTDHGSILVLDLPKREYSLAEIARLVESENAKILSTFITSGSEENAIELTLKVNLQNIQHILSTLERYDYKVKAAFQEADYLESLKERFDSLMTYLNV